MKNLASRTGIGVAVSVAAMSLVWAFFVPSGYPWPGVAWALLACAIAVAMAKRSILRPRSMSDVIGDVEAEPARARAAPERGVPSTRTVL